ncbi:MAG TPA: hypothetical protein VFX49_22495 [Chloroflexota bacterium]|nr:hypothetical protein [Chloroflexota bacterium]
MHANVLLPLASSLLSFLFCGLVFDQFLLRRKPYQLVWSVGLLWYALSAGTEFLGGAFGWNVALYRGWYLIGAIGVAAYLGLGTIYLLARTPFAWWAIGALVVAVVPAAAARHWDVAALGLAAAVIVGATRRRAPAAFGHAFCAVTVAGTLLAAWRVLGAPVDPAALPAGADEIVTGRGFPAEVRIMTPLFNIAGAFSLAIGAVYSALHFWRTRTYPHRAVSNVFIAVGAFVPSLTSGLSRFGLTQTFFLGELLGVVLIFAGFLISVEVFSIYRIPALGVTLRQRSVARQPA